MLPLERLAKRVEGGFPQFTGESAHLLADKNRIVHIGCDERFGKCAMKSIGEVTQLLHGTQNGDASA